MNSQQAAMSGTSITEKRIAVSTGLLALALGSGLGATPAEATLVTTQLNVNVAAGDSYNFGPNGDEFTVTNFGFAPGCDGGCTPSSFGLSGIGLQGNTTALSKNFVAVKAGGGSPPLLDFFKPGDAI